MQYVIKHVTRFTYPTPISENVMEVRMQPRTDASQRCLRFELSSSPRARMLAYHDQTGNIVHHFDIPNRHTRLQIVADAVIERVPNPAVPERLDMSAWDAVDAMTATGVHWDDLTFGR